ncbi:hypothetical protein KKH39_04740 [Patescibacteria group bacterium]|nr:hypothetical protein [Patescibacteria group bacterium]
MSLTKKISHIRNLKSIQPDKRWESTTKFDLLSEIASQNRLMQAQKLDRKEKLDLFASRLLNKLAPSFSRAVAVFLIIVMGTGVSYTAQASVPGQAFWPIKRSIEKAEITLTFSPIKETEIYIKHINERLNEIDKILGSENSTPEKQEKAIKQAVIHFTKDVVAVDSSLKIAKEEKKPLEVVELVKKVTDASKEVDNNLKKKKEVASADQNISDALNSAQAANKVSKDKAVALALEVHEEVLAASHAEQDKTDVENNINNETTTSEFVGNTNHNTTSEKDAESVKNLVKGIIASEIDETSQEVDTVKQMAEVAGAEDGSTLKKENMAVNQASGELERLDINNSEEVALILDEAKALLEDGFLRNAYEMIAQIKEEYQRAEVVLKEIEDAINNNNILGADLLETSDDNTSSTDENDSETETKSDDVPQTPEINTDLQASAIKVDPLLDPKQAVTDNELY